MTVGPIPVFNYLPTFDTPDQVEDFFQYFENAGACDPNCKPPHDSDVKKELETALKAFGGLASDPKARQALEKVLTALGEFARDPAKAHQDLQGALSDLAQDQNVQSSLQSLVSTLGDLVRRLKNQEELQEVEEIIRHHHRFDPWGIGGPGFGPPYRYI